MHIGIFVSLVFRLVMALDQKTPLSFEDLSAADRIAAIEKRWKAQLVRQGRLNGSQPKNIHPQICEDTEKSPSRLERLRSLIKR